MLSEKHSFECDPTQDAMEIIRDMPKVFDKTWGIKGEALSKSCA